MLRPLRSIREIALFDSLDRMHLLGYEPCSPVEMERCQALVRDWIRLNCPPEVSLLEEVQQTQDYQPDDPLATVPDTLYYVKFTPSQARQFLRDFAAPPLADQSVHIVLVTVDSPWSPASGVHDASMADRIPLPCKG